MRVLLLALLMLAAAGAVSPAATLTVKVEAIDPRGGTLCVSLYDEFTWYKSGDDPIASANVRAVAPETLVTLSDIKPGTYGIKLFQDANNNGRFDQNFIGLPLEHYGFSRDARPFLSAPSFQNTKFTVVEGDNTITIHLQ